MLRHLPPTATPLPLGALASAWGASPTALPQLRALLASYLGTPSFLASSGRTALYLLLEALHAAHPERRAVIMPAYTCPSLAKVTLDVGLEPRWVDLQPASLLFDYAHLASAIDDRTLAVIVVHPFGIPQDVEPALALARTAGAVLIEDAAQALGAAFADRPVGTRGDFGLFSFGPGKPLSTGGGGVLCVNHPAYLPGIEQTWQQLAAPTRVQSAVAWARLTAFTFAFEPHGWWLATRAGAQRVGDNEASWGYARTGLTASQAAVALAQLPRLDAYNMQRRENAERLIGHLRSIGGVQVIGAAHEQARPVYLRLPILAAETAVRDEVVRRLNAACIGAGRLYARTLPEFFPQIAGPTCPGAEQVAQRLLTLPTHHEVTPNDITRIVEVIRAVTGCRLH